MSKSSKDDSKLYGSIEIITNKLNAYFDYITTNAKELYNVTNFYIRNTMTGLKKSPEKRYFNEIEVLHEVFTSVAPLNNSKIKRYINKNDCDEVEAIENIKNKFFTYPTSEKWFLSKNLLDGIFKITKNKDYYDLPAHVNQNIIDQCVQDWLSYFESIKDYKVNRDKYTGKPQIPKYKKGEKTTATFSNQICKITKNSNNKYFLEFPKIKLDGYNKQKTKLCIGKLGNIELVHVKVKPEYGCYRINIVYIVESIKTNGTVMCGGDIGIDNLITLMDNNGDRPLIVDGKKLKSINQYYNKKIAHLQRQLQLGHTKPLNTSKQIQNLYLKRKHIIKDYMSKAACIVLKYCIENNITTLVIGENKQWKTEIDLSKKVNQNFCYIPHDLLKQQIKYRCERYGIKVICREESYTSKASLLDFDEIPNKSDKYSFSGKRITRGLYKTNLGQIINADVNGAGNILRKEYKDAFTIIENYQNPIKVKVM